MLVVAFSSSLDVAAIEMEVRRPLDYDFELRMIGLSNLLSGVTGGYTGSYIFSQTIFCLRSACVTRACSAWLPARSLLTVTHTAFVTTPRHTDGIRGRTCATVIALLELAAFLSPVSVISFLPRFFFGTYVAGTAAFLGLLLYDSQREGLKD